MNQTGSQKNNSDDDGLWRSTQPLLPPSMEDISDLLKAVSNEMNYVNTSQVHGGSTNHVDHEKKVEEEEDEEQQQQQQGDVAKVYGKEGTSYLGGPSRRGTLQVDGMQPLHKRKRYPTTKTHTMTERKRRDKIKSKLDELQQLLPNSNKMDRASMLDAAIAHMKYLQYQVHVLSGGVGNFHHGVQSPCSYLQQQLLPPAAATKQQQTPPVQFLRIARIPHYMPVGVGMGMVGVNSTMPSHLMPSPTITPSLGVGIPPVSPAQQFQLFVPSTASDTSSPPIFQIQSSSADQQQVPASVEKKTTHKE